MANREEEYENQGYHIEAVDRIDSVNTILDILLCQHPGITKHADVLALIDEASDKLGAAYQLLAEKED